MPERHALGPISDIPLGQGKEYVAAGRIVAVYNVDGTFHALDGICPHAGGPLAQGYVRGNIVTCPWHGWQFNVTTGQHCLNASLQHTTISVAVEDGILWAEL